MKAYLACSPANTIAFRWGKAFVSFHIKLSAIWTNPEVLSLPVAIDKLNTRATQVVEPIWLLMTRFYTPALKIHYFELKIHYFEFKIHYFEKQSFWIRL